LLGEEWTVPLLIVATVQALFFTFRRDERRLLHATILGNTSIRRN